MRTLLFLMVAALCAPGMSPAAERAVGKWACVSTDEAGAESNWTLVLKDEGGKISGTLSGNMGEFEVVVEKAEGSSLVFRFVVEGNTYRGEATIDGNQMSGKYKGPESSGTFKGVKQT